MPKVFYYSPANAERALRSLATHLEPWAERRRKVYALLASEENLQLDNIARRAGVNRKTVRKWVAWMEEQTPETAAQYNRGGRNQSLTREQEVELRRDMAAAPVPLTAVEIREWLAGKGIDRNVKQIYPLLSRLRLPFKRSRGAASVRGEP